MFQPRTFRELWNFRVGTNLVEQTEIWLAMDAFRKWIWASAASLKQKEAGIREDKQLPIVRRSLIMGAKTFIVNV